MRQDDRLKVLRAGIQIIRPKECGQMGEQKPYIYCCTGGVSWRKKEGPFKDKYFKDNWIVKSIKLKNSCLIGGNIFFDVKRYDQNEINDRSI